MSLKAITRYVRVGGVKTCFTTAGDGDPVVLIHGAEAGTSGGYAWRHNITALAEHFAVYALDRIGFGASDKPLITYSDSVLADHLTRFIDILCLESVSLVGNSMGAYGAAHYAVNHPDRVRSMVLVGSASVAAAMGIEYRPTHAPAAMRRVMSDPTAANVRAMLETLMENRSEWTGEFVDERIRRISVPGVRHAMESIQEYRKHAQNDANLRQRYNLEHRLPALTIPTAIIWGRNDRFAPIDLGHQLRDKLPNLAAFHVLEHSGHQAQHDAVTEFNAIVIDFLRRHTLS